MLDAQTRVLLDTNIFISYLLSTNAERVVVKVIQAAVLGDYQLLWMEDLLNEVMRTVQTKPALQQRIPLDALNTFIQVLRTFAEAIESITEPIPTLTRDPKDDYLLAYALVGQADYLVTEDNDLLVLRQVDNVKIINLAKFWGLLSA